MELNEYINQIKEKQLTEVDLSPYELELIPQEVFEFTWIEKLIVGRFLNYKDYEFEGKRTCKLKELQEDFTKLINLKSLAISGGLFGAPKPEYRNFELLGKLTSLKSLYIETTNLCNIEFLKSLNNLEDLQISHTEIKDYKPLKKLTKLKSLTLGDNEIEDIDFLQSFENLEALSLTTNKITSLDPIKHNTNLKRLCVCNNSIENYEALKQFSELEYFCNGSNHSIEILSNNKQLIEFEPQKIDQIGLNQLKEFKNLKTVNIWKFIGNSIDVSSLSPVENLQVYGDFESITGLESLKKLKSIHISSKKLDSIKIPYSENLQKIGIPECPIENFEFYSDFTAISELDISHTKINSLYPLEKIEQLTRLYCDNTMITSLKPILHLIREDFEINFWGEKIPEKLQEYYENNENEGIIKYYREHDR